MYLTADELSFYRVYCDACKRKVTLRQLADDTNADIDYLKRKIKRLSIKVKEISAIKTRPTMSWPKIKAGYIPRKTMAKAKVSPRTITYSILAEIVADETIH